MDIRRLHPDGPDGPGFDELVRQAAALETAVRAVDCPWFPPETELGVRNDVLRGWDGHPDLFWVGVEDGTVVARGSVFLPHWDNLHLAWVGATVHPDHRRRGLGSQMLEHVVTHARDAGRTVVGTDAWDGTPGAGFAEHRGFVRASQSIMRRHLLAEADLGAVRALAAEAAAASADYELVRVVGETPAELLDAVSEMSAAINDAPTDDLALEDEVFPPQRIRDYEAAQLANGMRLYRLLARHVASGELAGHTVVSVSGERPQQGWQHDTSVVRSHRGHRLGMRLKAAMVLWLAETEPQLQQVDTWNAESNDPMIGVNERLGYVWMGRQVELQRTF